MPKTLRELMLELVELELRTRRAMRSRPPLPDDAKSTALWGDVRECLDALKESSVEEMMARLYEAEIAPAEVERLNAVVTAKHAMILDAEAERDAAVLMHAECAKTHGSTYGTDWRQWQLANEECRSLKARVAALEAVVRGYMGSFPHAETEMTTCDCSECNRARALLAPAEGQPLPPIESICGDTFIGGPLNELAPPTAEEIEAVFQKVVAIAKCNPATNAELGVVAERHFEPGQAQAVQGNDGAFPCEVCRAHDDPACDECGKDGGR